MANHLSQYNEDAAIAILVLNCISFTALMIVILVYVCQWDKIASFPMRLVLPLIDRYSSLIQIFYLCLTCLVQNLYVIILNPTLVFKQEEYEKSSPFCDFQALLKVSSDLSSVIWTTLIIYSPYASIVLKKSLDSYEKWYLLIAYLFPATVSAIPAILGLYGYDIYFCWFSTSNDTLDFGLKWLYFFGPLWLLFSANSYFTFKTYNQLKKLQLQMVQLTIFKRLVLFPLILLISGIFTTMDQIYIYVSNDFSPWLNYTGVILLSMYGFFNALAYGFNPLIRDHILQIIGRKSIIRSNSFSTENNNARLEELIDR